MSQHTLRGRRQVRITDPPIPMVLAHATGLDASALYPLTKELAPRQCICAEYIGYPHGGVLPETSILEADAKTVETAIRKADRPVHLFGHSYGGRVALEVARRNLVEIETLIVFEPVVQGALPHRDISGLLDVHDDYEPFLRSLTDYWGGSGAWDALSPSYRAQQLRRAVRIHREVSCLANDKTPPNVFSALTVPTLVIRGDYGHEDAVCMTQAVADAVPASTLTVIPKAGHMAPIIDARTVGVVIKDWLGLR